MSFIDEFIAKANKIANKNPFILKTIKKIISLCPYLEKKICKTIDKDNINKLIDKKDKKILLSKTGKEIFNIISSSNFKKRSKNKQDINSILTSIDNIFNEKIDKKDALNKLEDIIHNEYDKNILEIISQRTAEYLYSKRENYIFIDYSDLAKKDSGTGIQRVSKNILKYLPHLSKYKVIPIYSEDTKYYGFKYCSKLVENEEQENEEIIEFIPNDILFFPELSTEQTLCQKSYLNFLNKKGIKIINFIHDLVPIRNPETCQNAMVEIFPIYINSLLDYTCGAICNSKATAEDLKEYIKEYKSDIRDDFKIEWIHLGSDFEKSSSSTGIPEDSEFLFKAIESKTTFLSVSTIEPRKMYNQILEAFEILWNKNQDINLVIVGQNGWNTEKLVKKIENHREINKHLFRLSRVSDEYLNKIYEKSSALIMASKAEGFGLGIIEATYHKKPLIIRDIPVFREIAEENAFYFNGFEGKNLANAIEKWIELYKENKHPKSDNIKYLTWKESIKMLNEKLELITK